MLEISYKILTRLAWASLAGEQKRKPVEDKSCYKIVIRLYFLRNIHVVLL